MKCPIINYKYFYNEEEYCFYLEDRKTKYKDFFKNYEKSETTEEDNGTYFIKIDNYIYQLKYPGDVEFIFPPQEKKDKNDELPKSDTMDIFDKKIGSEEDIKVKKENLEKTDKSIVEEKKINIFISSHRHIDKILSKYEDYDYYYFKDGEENFKKFERKDLSKIYPVKKIKISFKKYEEIYNYNYQFIKDYSKLNPNNLSLSYEKYLKYSENIKEGSGFFNLTKERQEFFKYLDEKLKETSVFLPLCGPEGIGKTSSILAYCKVRLKQDYFYYNARVFNELLKDNKENEIKNTLVQELSRVIDDTDLNRIIGKIMEYKNFNCKPIEFLIHILQIITPPEVLIIDQYKTALDEDYFYLKQLYYQYNTSLKIILLSSMNEDDVKNCFSKGIKNEDITKDNFFLDYLYIKELAKVGENDLKCLDEEEKEVLESFGNLYSIFYEIVEFKKKNFNRFHKTKFLEKIGNDIKANLYNYYKTKDKIDIDHLLSEIIDIEVAELKKEEFLNIYINIPFRYFKLSIDKKNIFKISDINNANEFKFEYLYNYFIIIIANLKGENYLAIKKDEKLLENAKKGIIPFEFENNAFYCIWGNKKFNGDVIRKKIKISSIFELSDDDCSKINDAKKDIKVGEGIILSQTKVTAPLFDTGILVMIKPNIWRLYVIQITRKKESRERLTTISLDDFFGYINSFLEIKCTIKVEQNYFCYIFDNNKRDNVTINYCKEKKLDYIFFDEKDFNINYENGNLREYKMKKIIIENNKVHLPRVEEFDIKKFYPEEKNFEATKDFLQKKRALISHKDFNANKELVKRFKIKENYYNKINNNFQKGKKLDYNDMEETINNYLVDTTFLNKDLVGIQLLIPNQDNCEQKLIEEGFTKEEIDNFYAITKKNSRNLVILNIKKIEYFIASLHVPEFNTYIIYRYNNQGFYQDFENKKTIILSTNVTINFNTTFDENIKYFAITFTNKNLAREQSSISNKKAIKFKIENN